jgi:hypothetical protein
VVPYGGIQGILYEDVNDSGAYEGGVDLPLSKARVTLLDLADQVIAVRITQANGLYYISGLEPNRTYQIRQEPPFGYAPASNSEIRLFIQAGSPVSEDFGHRRYDLLYLPLLRR